MTLENLMLWIFALMSCVALGLFAAERAGRDLRQEGESDTSARVVGAFTGSFIGGFLILMTAAIWVVFDGTDETTRTAAATAGAHTVDETQVGASQGGVDMGVDAFIERFNLMMGQAGMSYRASGAPVDVEGGETMFRNTLGEDLMLTGRVAPETKAVKSLLFIGNDEAPQGIGPSVMTVAAVTVLASHPAMEMSEALRMVTTLVEAFNRQGEASSLTREGITYTYQHQAQLGNVFTVNLEG